MREAPDDGQYEAEYFRRARHLHDPNSSFHRYRIANILGLHTPGPTDSVLDMGTGWGTIAFVVAPLAREVVGIDLSDHSVSFCRDRLAHADPAPNNVRFMQGDVRDCGLPSESFDVVYAADLFEHLWPEESNLTVAEACRVLRPGGMLVVWMPCRSHAIEVLRNRNIILRREPGHVDYKSMPRTKAMLTNAGFDIVSARYAESHLPLLRTVERLGKRWIPLLRRRIGIVGRKP
ncbi:MAG: class I SAM-dependent methyltransferase [Gemmatimonadetes bacterium]|nr:class I SAM-dependent methyltransferase [Candidatus Palauibacter rhopaloidicola]